MKRLQIHVTNKQLATLRKVSKQTGLTIAELVRRAVDALYKWDK